MKLTKYLVLGAAMLSMVACNKKDDVKEFDATVSVKIASSELRLDEAASKKLTSLTAMVYSGDVQEAIETVNDKNEVTGIKCKTGAKKLVIVANYDAASLKGLSLTALLKLTQDLADQQPTDLVMTSEVKEIVLVPGTNKYGYPGGNLGETPLSLTRINARAEFVKLEQAMSPLFVKYKVEYTRIAALIAKKQTNLFNSANTDDAYVYGIETPRAGYTPAVGKYTENTGLVMACPADDLPEHAGFYLLENSSAEHPTILVLEGTLKQANGNPLSPEDMKAAFEAGWIKSETDATTYYPVRINWQDAMYTYENNHIPSNKIERNNYYKISLKITGPGTNKPEDPITLATLDVNCQVVDWKTVEQKVEW